jgi:hypothetical protein
LRQLFLIVIGITPSYLVMANIPLLIESMLGIGAISNSLYRLSLIGLIFFLTFPIAIIILKIWGKALLKLNIITDIEANRPPFNWGYRYF